MSGRRRVGAGLLTALALAALLLPMALPIDPLAQDLSHILGRPTLADPLGTDQLGRSMLARLLLATRLSLAMAGLSVVSAAIPGILAGMLAAWRGGLTERLLVGLGDAVLSLPGLLLIILLAGFAPGHFWPLYVGLSLSQWVEYFRVTRAASRSVLAGPQVEASRLLGFGPAYVIRRHLWPELAPLLSTLMTFGASTAVLALATLGFIGVGLRPPTAELGLMMIELLPHYAEAPWLIAAPVAVLMLTVLALSMLTAREARA